MISFFNSGIYSIFKKTNCTFIIRTSMGLKTINSYVNSGHFNFRVLKTFPNMDIKKIISTPDFLKDKFTLLGTAVEEWPHLELIEYLDQNKQLQYCDYVRRMQLGILDTRWRKKVSIKQLKIKYQQELEQMKKGSTLAVRIYHAYNDTYAVADGRHALAMAYYFNYPKVRYDLVFSPLFDSMFLKLFKILENDREYTKHQEFFKRVYEYRKREVDQITQGNAY